MPDTQSRQLAFFEESAGRFSLARKFFYEVSDRFRVRQYMPWESPLQTNPRGNLRREKDHRLTSRVFKRIWEVVDEIYPLDRVAVKDQRVSPRTLLHRRDLCMKEFEAAIKIGEVPGGGAYRDAIEGSGNWHNLNWD